MDYEYVSLIQHPGIVLIVRDKTATEVVLEMLKQILSIWSLLFVNVLLMIFAGCLIWISVSRC